MNAMSKLDRMANAIFAFFGVSSEVVAPKIVPAAPAKKEVFEVKSTEYFTNLVVHIAALDKELRRVQSFLRSSSGLSWKQERGLAAYIDYAVAFKAAFKQGRETAKIIRSRGDRHERFELEIFDNNGNPVRSVSYEAEFINYQ